MKITNLDTCPCNVLLAHYSNAAFYTQAGGHADLCNIYLYFYVNSEPSQEQLIAEVRSLLSDLKQEAARLTAKVDRVELKSDNNEKTLVELKNLLAQLTPKLDDAAAFAKHRAPSLVDKADLTEATTKLRLEIDKRPTRRQAIFDLAWVFGLIAGAVAFGSRAAR